MTKTSLIQTACSRYTLNSQIKEYLILKQEGWILQKLTKFIFLGVYVRRYGSVEMLNFPLSSYCEKRLAPERTTQYLRNAPIMHYGNSLLLKEQVRRPVGHTRCPG